MVEAGKVFEVSKENCSLFLSGKCGFFWSRKQDEENWEHCQDSVL
jgi:hypothetical protein